MNGYATIPVIIGSRADIIPEEQRTAQEISHEWSCYVRVQPSLVKSVQFKLHESFTTPVQTLTAAPYEITEHGWGEFSIQIKIILFNDEKIQTSHYLRLHSTEYPLVAERYDTIVYRGKQEAILDEYNFQDAGEDKEFKKIEGAIQSVLDLYEEAKQAKAGDHQPN